MWNIYLLIMLHLWTIFGFLFSFLKLFLSKIKFD